tara:strand:- start:249 stop:1577 length:1329 start_codon:yes stop_codon:yes gene_type:complete
VGRKLEDLAYEILDKAMKSAQSAEVFYIHSNSSPVSFEANAVKSVESHETRGAALRVIKDGRVGFSATSRLSDPDLLVESALETALLGPNAAFDFPSVSKFEDIPVSSDEIPLVTINQMVDLGNQIIQEIRAQHPDVKVEGGVGRNEMSVNMVNSANGHFHYEKTSFGYGFEATLIRGDDMLFVHDGRSSVGPYFEIDETVNSIFRQLEWAKNSASIKTSHMPVIFLPSAVPSVIISPLVSALSGKSVLLGTSPLAGKIGEQVLSSEISLTDDPTLPNITGSRICDDEGIPSANMPLVNKGKISNFYYDLQTAGLAGTNSTGHGERSLGSLPSPSTSVIIVEEGKISLGDMISGLKEGLIVEHLLGAGQGNALGGDFNANVLLGYKVENGAVTGRVKDTMVSGNVYKVLNDSISIGKDGRWLGGSLFSPSILCDNVSVASKA